MKVVDLFCGAGGLSHGFQKAGFEIVLGIDKEEDFLKSFKKSHTDAEAVQADLSEADIEKIIKGNGIESEEIDLVIGGPPCQGFSTVGDREEEDERNKLVRKFAETIDELGPDAFLMENVPGLRSMEDEHGNKVVEELQKLFKKHGYETDYRILKASDFGVPQDRKRLFIIGMKEDIEDFEWPKGSFSEQESLEIHSGNKKGYRTVEEAISDLPGIEAGEKETTYPEEADTEYQEQMRKNSNTVYNHKTPKHSETVLERLKNIPQGGNHGDLPEDLKLNSGYGNIYGRLEMNEPADTITGNFGCVSAPGRFIHPENDRALTVREGARIQSFPDNYQFFGTQSNQYKQVGNAVPPLMAEEIAREIKRAVKNS